jgi:hypothetical protein
VTSHLLLPVLHTDGQVDISKSDNFRGYMKLLSENNDP